MKARIFAAGIGEAVEVKKPVSTKLHSLSRADREAVVKKARGKLARKVKRKYGDDVPGLHEGTVHFWMPKMKEIYGRLLK